MNVSNARAAPMGTLNALVKRIKAEFLEMPGHGAAAVGPRRESV